MCLLSIYIYFTSKIYFPSLTSPLPISPPWVTRRTRVPPFRKPEPDSWRLTKASSAKEDTARAAVGVAEGENAAESILCSSFKL